MSDYLDALYGERFGRSEWWPKCEHTKAEEVAAAQQHILLRAAEVADELELEVEAS